MPMNYALFFIKNPSNELLDAIWSEYSEFSDMNNIELVYGINRIYLCPLKGDGNNDEWFIDAKKGKYWTYSKLIKVTKEEIDKFIVMHRLVNMSFVEFMKLNR